MPNYKKKYKNLLADAKINHDTYRECAIGRYNAECENEVLKTENECLKAENTRLNNLLKQTAELN